MLFDEIYELLVIYCTCTNYNNIISVIVSCVVFSNLIKSEFGYHISVTFFRLSQHVLSVDIEVYVFEKGFFISCMVFFVMSECFVFQ